MVTIELSFVADSILVRILLARIGGQFLLAQVIQAIAVGVGQTRAGKNPVVVARHTYNPPDARLVEVANAVGVRVRVFVRAAVDELDRRK